MTALIVRAVIGVVGSVAIVWLAWRGRALTAGGAVAAAIVGFAALTAGWSWAAMLLLYFDTSSALSRWDHEEKATHTAGVVEKGGVRDAAQVFSNGAVFCVAAIGSIIAPSFIHASCLALGAGSLAASAADTWATEIGTLRDGVARSILTWRKVPTGTSGGVSTRGSIAAAAGAAFIGLLALVLGWSRFVAVAAFVGGLAGCLVDSLIGATVQGRRTCPLCRMETEQRVHPCGTPTIPSSGFAWINNDAVNLLACTAGGIVAVALLRAMHA